MKFSGPARTKDGKFDIESNKKTIEFGRIYLCVCMCIAIAAGHFSFLPNGINIK